MAQPLLVSPVQEQLLAVGRADAYGQLSSALCYSRPESFGQSTWSSSRG